MTSIKGIINFFIVFYTRNCMKYVLLFVLLLPCDVYYVVEVNQLMKLLFGVYEYKDHAQKKSML